VVLALPFGIVYILLTAAFGLGGGAAAAAAVVIGMFLLRRDNKKPIVGAFAVGAAIAFALYGTCLIIIAKSS
jgi:4-diphosphocytidyl-2C-methyl-D-erythritol kinase